MVRSLVAPSTSVFNCEIFTFYTRTYHLLAWTLPKETHPIFLVASGSVQGGVLQGGLWGQGRAGLHAAGMWQVFLQEIKSPPQADRVGGVAELVQWSMPLPSRSTTHSLTLQLL